MAGGCKRDHPQRRRPGAAGAGLARWRCWGRHEAWRWLTAAQPERLLRPGRAQRGTQQAARALHRRLWGRVAQQAAPQPAVQVGHSKGLGHRICGTRGPVQQRLGTANGTSGTSGGQVAAQRTR